MGRKNNFHRWVFDQMEDIVTAFSGKRAPRLVTEEGFPNVRTVERMITATEFKTCSRLASRSSTNISRGRKRARSSKASCAHLDEWHAMMTNPGWPLRWSQRVCGPITTGLLKATPICVSRCSNAIKQRRCCRGSHRSPETIEARGGVAADGSSCSAFRSAGIFVFDKDRSLSG